MCQTSCIPTCKYFISASLLTSFWYQVNEADDIEDNVAHLVALARLALEKGDVDRAQEILRLGLKIAEDHKFYSGVVYLYDILSTIALSEGDIKQVENLMTAVIEKLSLWGFPDDHYNIIDFKLRLSRIFSANGSDQLANVGFETCLNQQQAKILSGDTSEKTGILYVNILFWYGVHKLKNNRYTEAKHMISNAYEYSTKIKLLTAKQEMIILYTLADVSTQLGDLEVALTSMLDAIVLAKGIGSVDTPSCYLKLGGIYEKIGFLDKAKFAYDEALKSASVLGYYDIVTNAERALGNLKQGTSNSHEE
ncbi:Tetratricopeptide repeat domain 19 [Carabus blaptoides fortunei]